MKKNFDGGPKFQDLAEEFKELVELGSKSIWKAAEVAFKIKSFFPKSEVWSIWTPENLGKDSCTVDEWIRGFKYCQEFEPERLKANFAALPRSAWLRS